MEIIKLDSGNQINNAIRNKKGKKNIWRFSSFLLSFSFRINAGLIQDYLSRIISSRVPFCTMDMKYNQYYIYRSAEHPMRSVSLYNQDTSFPMLPEFYSLRVLHVPLCILDIYFPP